MIFASHLLNELRMPVKGRGFNSRKSESCLHGGSIVNVVDRSCPRDITFCFLTLKDLKSLASCLTVKEEKD